MSSPGVMYAVNQSHDNTHLTIHDLTIHTQVHIHSHTPLPLLGQSLSLLPYCSRREGVVHLVGNMALPGRTVEAATIQPSMTCMPSTYPGLQTDAILLETFEGYD
jgi:hypothetical protein